MGGKFKCDFRHVLALKSMLCNKNTKDQTKFLSKNIWLLKSEKFKIQIMKKYSCLTFQLWVGINDNKIGCEYTVRKKHILLNRVTVCWRKRRRMHSYLQYMLRWQRVIERWYNITGSSCLMRISLLRISLMRFFKTITKIWLMRFYGPFVFVTAYIE